MSLERVCPHCGKAVQDEAALFCPYCARALKKTRFPLAGGILTLVAAGLSLFVAVVGIVFLQSHYNIDFDAGDYNSEAWIMSFFGLCGFIFGLPSSIFSIKRIHFGFSIFGIGVVLASASLSIIYAPSLIGGLLFGLPILLPSLTSLVFISITRSEFS
jgi:hypothetical protein